MGFLNWMQNKVTGGKDKKILEAGSSFARCTSNGDPCKEEFSDWPQGFLAIGTLGNKELKDDTLRHESSKEQPDFSLEEVIKLQKELTKLLTLKPESVGLLTDDGDDGSLSPKSKIILNKAKYLLADNRNTIARKSFSFLLKKMFLCRSGFVTQSLRDPPMESRIDKLLRTLLHKKIYPHNSAPASTKKYLVKKATDETSDQDEMPEKQERCKWVRTDSEFIVLEI